MAQYASPLFSEFRNLYGNLYFASKTEGTVGVAIEVIEMLLEDGSPRTVLEFGDTTIWN